MNTTSTPYFGPYRAQNQLGDRFENLILRKQHSQEIKGGLRKTTENTGNDTKVTLTTPY